MKQNALILSPHTDDGEIGCGATIAKLTEQNWRVYYVAFSTGTATTREVTCAVRLLGIREGDLTTFQYPTRYFYERRQDILQQMINIRDKIEPEMVFCPATTDTHQDHQIIAAETHRAFKGSTILGYELPWNCQTFRSECFSKVEVSHMRKKWAAMVCYQSQKDRPYFTQHFIYGLASVRGVQIGGGLAEAFEGIRWII